VEFISDRIPYIILSGSWCSIVVPNAHDPCEEDRNGESNTFYEELWSVFGRFPWYYVKMFLNDFNAKVSREDIFKPTIGNETSHGISNDDGVRVVNFATSKTYLSKAQCSLVRFINTLGPLLRETHTTRLITFCYIEDTIQIHLMSDLPEGLTVILTIIW
jgi:hypothetical protein